jgi:hypothetical protein
MTASALCFLMALITIWINPEILFQNWKLLETLIVLTVSVAHISLLLTNKGGNNLADYTLTATISCISIVAFILVLLIFGVFDDSEYFFKVLAVFAILDVFGTITTVIFSRMQRAI